MSKSIKLVALVGDEEVVVGRCHPGQARILRKNGMAEWKKDSLVLLGAIPKFSEPEPISPYDDPFAPWTPYGMAEKKVIISDDSWKDEVEDFIDPKRELVTTSATDAQEWNQGKRPVPTESKCQTFKDWFNAAKGARGAGHPLYVANDYRRLYLGFVDDTDNIVFYFSLAALKSTTDEELESLGLDPKVFRKDTEARNEAMGLQNDLDWVKLDGPVEADPELEALWTQEVEETVGAELRRQEAIVLASRVAKVWTDSAVRTKLKLKPREKFLEGWNRTRRDQPSMMSAEDWAKGRRSGLTTEAAIKAALRALNGEKTLIQGREFFEVVRDFVARCDSSALALVELYKRGKEGEVYEDEVREVGWLREGEDVYEVVPQSGAPTGPNLAKDGF
jgi:hypothetical protein